MPSKKKYFEDTLVAYSTITDGHIGFWFNGCKVGDVHRVGTVEGIGVESWRLNSKISIDAYGHDGKLFGNAERIIDHVSRGIASEFNGVVASIRASIAMLESYGLDEDFYAKPKKKSKAKKKK